MPEEPIYVSTRVGFGATTSGAATPVAPSSFSLVEPGVSTGSQRYWKWTATDDGALRVDPSLSMPGPNARLLSRCFLQVLSDDPGTIPIHFDDGTTGETVEWGGSGSILVEAGMTYYFRIVLQYVSGPAVWGPVLRVSSLRTPEPTWYQPEDRTVTTYASGDTGWMNLEPAETWDETLGARDPAEFTTEANSWRFGAGGHFEWKRSFGGLDPISGLSTTQAVELPWLHAISGIDQEFYAAPGFDGTLAGTPPDPPWSAPAWDGNSAVQAGQSWTYQTSTAPPFTYVYSRFDARGTFQAISLTWERWRVGPTVGYTPTELAAVAGTTTGEVVGFVYESDRPDIEEVQVLADWDEVALGDPAPVQWWAGVTRLLPDLQQVTGTIDFPTEGIGWGPAWGVRIADTIPGPSYYPDFAGVLEGGEEGRPHDYIAETGMQQIGTYEAGDGLPAYVVPPEVWQAALEQEPTWADLNTLDEDEEIISPQTFQPRGLTFLAGTEEYLDAAPTSAGLTTPALGTTVAKGLNQVRLWPKITYRPTRFQVVLAPDLEIPLLPIAGGPPRTRQHFEPIPPD